MPHQDKLLSSNTIQSHQISPYISEVDKLFHTSVLPLLPAPFFFLLPFCEHNSVHGYFEEPQQWWELYVIIWPNTT